MPCIYFSVAVPSFIFVVYVFSPSVSHDNWPNAHTHARAKLGSHSIVALLLDAALIQFRSFVSVGLPADGTRVFANALRSMKGVLPFDADAGEKHTAQTWPGNPPILIEGYCSSRIAANPRLIAVYLPI